MAAGKLYLVGAGPGDPGLLTLKGKRCLEEADVVIYDYLANPRLLEHARPEAERVLVGKHGGGTRVDQAMITSMLVERAQRGQVVVRLKGGDPFLFGRGAEEAAAARAAGVMFEVVPGVTSATAVPAYAGIPLTHRDLASSVVIATGYEYPEKSEPAVHWDQLARSGSTLVLLMTQRQLRANMARLMAGGMAPDVPVALVQWGTRADQRTVVGTAATIADLADAQDIRPPALAVVGAVVRLRQELAWFESKPLFGRRIVVTRPRTRAADLIERLEAEGADVLPFPTIATVPPSSYAGLDAALARPRDFDWVVFTSVNGVRVFCERLGALGGDIRAWAGARLAAIGPQTAQSLRELCLRVDVVPETFQAEGVVAALERAGVGGRRVLLPRAAGARDILPQQLRTLGAEVEEVVTYQTVLPADGNRDEMRAWLRERVDLVVFTSSSTVHNFVAALEGEIEALRTRVAVGCIGPITAETARSYGLRVVLQPERYTAAALADAIVRHYESAARVAGA